MGTGILNDLIPIICTDKIVSRQGDLDRRFGLALLMAHHLVLPVTRMPLIPDRSSIIAFILGTIDKVDEVYGVLGIGRGTDRLFHPEGITR